MKDMVAMLEEGTGRGQKDSEAHEERLRMAWVWPQKTRALETSWGWAKSYSWVAGRNRDRKGHSGEGLVET